MALLIFHFPQICMSEISGSFICLAEQTTRPFRDGGETHGQPVALQRTRRPARVHCAVGQVPEAQGLLQCRGLRL